MKNEQPPPPIITTNLLEPSGGGHRVVEGPAVAAARTSASVADERRRSIVDPDGNFEKFLIGGANEHAAADLLSRYDQYFLDRNVDFVRKLLYFVLAI